MDLNQLASMTEAIIDAVQCLQTERAVREVSEEEAEEAVKSFQDYALNPEPSEPTPLILTPQAETP